MNSSFVLDGRSFSKSAAEHVKSYSENSPLLDSGSIRKEHEASTFHKTSIYSWPVSCVILTALCVELTVSSIIANIVLFATQSDHLNMTAADASILTFAYQGACCTMPLLGGWLADSYTGKFNIILFSSIIYLVATILLPFASITNDASEHSDWAANAVTTNRNFMKSMYIIGLFLNSFGRGGLDAALLPFGADQLLNREAAATRTLFSSFYWSVNVGSLLAMTFVVYVQQNVSFFYGYLIPTCSMALALTIFLAGGRSYIIRPPAGSILSVVLKIIKEAIKNSGRPRRSDSSASHWLDRANRRFGGSYNTAQVEDTKKICRLVPILATFILYWTVWAQMATSMNYQGQNMDTNVGSHFQIPVASLMLPNILSVLVAIPIFNKLVYPLLAKLGIRLGLLQRGGIGMLFASASMLWAGRLEWSRVEQCCTLQQRVGEVNGTLVSSMSIFYQIPQFTLIGVSEVFTVVAGLELVYLETPKSLRSMVNGVFFFTRGLGTFCGGILVAIINAVTGAVNGEHGKWYPNKQYINKSPHLAYYFFLLAGLAFVNFIVYVFVAFSFKKKKESANRKITCGSVM